MHLDPTRAAARTRMRIVVIATALLLLAAPAAATAAAAAVDEYSLGVAGGTKVGPFQVDLRPTHTSKGSSADALGVVGETQAISSPLGDTFSSIGGTLLVLAGGAALGGFAVLMVIRRQAES